MRKSKLTILLSVIGLISFWSCKDAKSTNPQNTDFKLDGKWYAIETTTSNCGGANPEIEYNIYVIQQNGNEFTISVEGDSGSWEGKVENDKISWNVSRPSDNGVSDISFSGTIATDGNSISGTATWIWNSNSSSSTCSGTTTISANKIKPAEINLGGKWEGTWSSTGGSYSGTFTTSVTQDGSTLTGFISVPEIGMTAAKLKGIVSGKTVAFGDIDEIIRFSGNVAEDTSKMSGEFYYSTYNVSGLWNGQYSGPPDSMVVIIDSLDITIAWQKDIAFGAGKFFVLGSDNITIYDQSGVMTASIPTPGNYPRGVAFGNSEVICGDGAWGLGKIFEIDPDGKSILRSPSNGGFTGFFFDGVYLWALNDSYDGSTYIYKLTESGQKIDSIAVSGRDFGGLTGDANYLWYSAKIGFGLNEEFRIYKIDHSGSDLGYFSLPDWTSTLPGLAYDDSKLWYAGNSYESSYLYALSDAGNKIDSIALTISVGDIAWDGSYFWLTNYHMSGGAPENVKLYKMNTEGAIIDSITSLGGWSDYGLAANAMHLWTESNTLQRIYRIPTSGANYFPAPPNDFLHLTYDGTTYWIATDEDQLIKFDRNGNILNTYTGLIENSFAGITYDGDGIWFIEKAFNLMVKLAKIDLNGNIVASYAASPNTPEPEALCYDGSSLWMTGRRGYSDNYYLYEITIDLP